MRSEDEIRLKRSYWQGVFDALNTANKDSQQKVVDKDNALEKIAKSLIAPQQVLQGLRNARWQIDPLQAKLTGLKANKIGEPELDRNWPLSIFLQF
jgi:hypothetical protein